jgi:CHASE2 domain-containing sensor protein
LNYSNRIEFNNITSETKELLKEKIVIIGVSSKEHSDDISPTPLGDMLGMYVIGNAIFEIINNKQIKKMNWIYAFLMEIIIIISASIVFKRFDSVIAYLIITGSLILVLGPISIVAYYKKGIFVNVIFPILGMGIHKSVSEYEEAISIVRGRGKR